MFKWKAEMQDNIETIIQSLQEVKKTLDFCDELILKNRNLVTQTDLITEVISRLSNDIEELKDYIFLDNKERIEHIEDRIVQQNKYIEEVRDLIINNQKERIEHIEDRIIQQNKYIEEVRDLIINNQKERIEHIEDRIIQQSKHIEEVRELLIYDQKERIEHIEDKLDASNKMVKQSIEDIWVMKKQNIPVLEKSLPSDKTRIHFIRCLDKYNVGDLVCGPLLYFKKLFEKYYCIEHTIKDVNYDLIKTGDWVVLGGGGIVDCNPLYQSAINKILSISNNVVAWGVGHNISKESNRYYWNPDITINYDRFKVFSSRDWGYDDVYCPCVSCMMSSLDNSYESKREIGVYEHHEFKIPGFSDYEKIDNSSNIDEVINFIGSSSIIITNSYHGAYWATLMKKKVIIYEPFSNRFDYFKYKPVVYSGNLYTDIKNAKVYSDALDECRELNITFSNKLIKLIEKTNNCTV